MVRHVGDMSPEDVNNDTELTRRIREINLVALKQIVVNGILIDTDLMIGYARDGSRKIICDPDWIKKASIRERIKFTGLFAKTLAMSYISELRNPSSSAEERHQKISNAATD